MDYKNEPLVSIIIVNYNGKHHLEKCLESLMKIDYENYEIILVDNNSADGSREFVEKLYTSVKIIKLDKNYGFAEPNNIGTKSAKGDLLLFLNNDTIVTFNFLSELVNVLNKEPDITICQSLLLKPNGDIDSSGDYIDVLGRAYSSRKKVNEVKDIFSARGASMIIRKKNFVELGGFEKTFFASFEDVALGWKAWLWGYRVVIVPKSIVYHLGGQTIKNSSLEIKFHGAKNSLFLRLVYFESLRAISSICKLFFVILMKKSFTVKVIPDPEISPPLPSYSVIFKAVGWILKNSRYILKKRREVNSKKVKTTDELIEMGLITKLCR